QDRDSPSSKSVHHVRDTGIAVRIGAVVTRETSIRKVVAERMPNKISRLGIANEIAAACRIAPRALRVPVPGFDEQLRVLTIAYGLPARREHLLHDCIGE